MLNCLIKLIVKLIFNINILERFLTLMSKYCFTLKYIENVQYNFELKLKNIFEYYGFT